MDSISKPTDTASTAPQTQPFIRPYDRDRDLDACIHIFRETAASDLRANNRALEIAEWIWCRPYLLATLSPQFGIAFVLDDGMGKAVGYVIGTPDTRRFVKQWNEEYLSLLDQFFLRGGGQQNVMPDWVTKLPEAVLWLLYHPAEGMLHERDAPSLVEEYPAHLHIDILGPYQRKGFGRKMLEIFTERLGKEDVDGVYLAMASSNGDKQIFYEKCGFERYREVLDGNISGENGLLPDGGIVMVRKL